MASFEHSFPFSAVAGQERVKRALLLCAVNPAIGGVLLSGQKGTAKSTLARGLARLLGDVPFVELPLNVTEDRLVGSLDLETAVREGRRSPQTGLLCAADGGFLYADEVNLLPEHIVNDLLEVSASGINRVEREGISFAHPARFVLIGSMNPEEGTLRSQFLDRFGLYVTAEGERDEGLRCEIIRRRLAYEREPASFCAQWRVQDEALAARLRDARERLHSVVLDESLLHFAAGLAAEGCCAGHRAELTLCETARAAATLDGRSAVSEEDLREAALYALPHRLREPVRLDGDQTDPTPLSEQELQQTDATAPQAEETGWSGEKSLEPDASPDSDCEQKTDEENSSQVCQMIEPQAPFALHFAEPRGFRGGGTGKRLKTRSATSRGRYVRYRMPSGPVRDIALDATLRAAAMHEREPDSALLVTVRDGDLREKVRERRTGLTILFLVDASGSMGARRRMGAVKGAVLSMLGDAYRKRDAVGIAAFRNEGTAVVLPFTRSVDLAEKHLRSLTTGGRTPLADGICSAYELLRAARIREPGSAQLLVLVTDGRANVSRADPFAEALKMAERAAAEPVQTLVLDTESGFARFGMAKKLAEALQGDWLPLNTVSKSEIEQGVRAFMERTN